jgi:hypothetical protein
MKLDSYINSKWFKDLNIKSETVKLLEENRKKLQVIVLGNNFWDMTLKAQRLKQKNEQMGLPKKKKKQTSGQRRQ